MTEPTEHGEPDTVEGTENDIVATRILYNDPAGTAHHLDFDGRLMVVEAIALKKTAQMPPATVFPGAIDGDPEAIRAIVWMLRRFRGGETDLKLHDVDFDLLSVRYRNIDAHGRIVVLRDPADSPPEPEGSEPEESGGALRSGEDGAGDPPASPAPAAETSPI